ncbi:uncharacterized protein [Aegilops tauschii subsp. strangulata]|uniref:Uncharacterized protein n=5 Tax=Aegilops tauschii subsp. strangulata TaxID=200361 RepID=A0A453H7Z1_AEGTS|nr:uncharacterized protein LOC109753885 isoform X1 [Aegilops tauschii subsp. strangulata]
MELKFEEVAALDKDNVNGVDGSITVRSVYPLGPCPHFEYTEGFDMTKINELMAERSLSMAKSRANDIIIPDPTPEWVCDDFFDKYAKLEPIFSKDNVRRFLRLFRNGGGKAMSWDLSITAQTLTFLVSFNALQCAQLVLEGEAPELRGMHANPNCINKYGYFPLHQAAERFSVDMIKLLLRHGASANVRTVGKEIIEDLLPLHVAVENTCLHKYLEDNLSPSQNHLDYIYNLIRLLCLPEMKIFLDTTRLLAEKTNNLLGELWKYIEDGKLTQSAVLLLAAQEQIRGGCSSSSKKDGFDMIKSNILRLSFTLIWGKGSNEMPQKLLEEMKALYCAGLLVDVISRVGEPLSAYIQAHSEVPHVEVLEHVSSILKEYGFCPTGDSMDTLNLQPYDCKKSDRESCGSTDANRAATKTANLHAAKKKAARKEVGGGWDPTYARRRFFPYWRSVLQARFPFKVYPTYARTDARSVLDIEHLHASVRNSMANGSTPTPIIVDPVGRISPLTRNNQPTRRLLLLLVH